MKRFRVIFMGTPDFAVPCLARLVEISDVVAVVTQPDRPKGRGPKPLPPPDFPPSPAETAPAAAAVLLVVIR